MRDPDAVSALAKGWKLRYPTPTALETWLVTGPFHPFWNWWMVTVITLEDIAGYPPAHKQYPTAKYEFGIYSLDPDHPVDIDTLESDGGRIHTLEPPDCIVQFGDLPRAEAAELVTQAAHAIVGGQSPDADFQAWWQTTVLRAVEHARIGGHMPMAQA